MVRGIFCGLFLFFTCASLEGDPLAHVITTRMEARYRSAKTLEATFLERYSENARLLRSESGTAYFRRPGKMRWEYEAPEKELFLVDGKTAWFYVPADHTVTRVPAKQSTDFRTPMALLAGEMKVSRVCARVELVSTEKPQTEGNLVLYCAVRGTPDDGSQHGSDPETSEHPRGADAVFFEVVPESGELARILVRQSGGVQVEFRFADWRYDPPLSASMFRFQVPPGVAIVNGDLASGAPGSQ
jgi:outer membrane lipoprotein carrier protein